MKYIFYGSILLGIVIAIMIMFHYTSFGVFSLDPTSGAIVTVPIGTSGTNTAYATSTLPTCLSTAFPNVKQINYTVSFDVYIASSQNTDAVRVLFYNGKQVRNPSIQSCGGGITTDCDANLGTYMTQGASGASAVQVAPNDISDIQNAILGNGGNICVYLSPDTNDLNVMYYVAGKVWRSSENVITSWIMGSSYMEYGSDGSDGSDPGTLITSGSTPVYAPDCGSSGTVRIGDVDYDCESGENATGTEQNGWVTTMEPVGNYASGAAATNPANITVKNVPLQTPFRVTLAVDPNFIEVYINGNLVITAKTPVTSEIYVAPSDGVSFTNFMGPPDFTSFCKVGNITYWNQVLPAKSIRLFCSTPAAPSVFTQS